MRRVKAGGGRAAPGRGGRGGRKASPKDRRGGGAPKRTAVARGAAARRRPGRGAGKGGKPRARRGPGPGGRRARPPVTQGATSAGGRMQDREERRAAGMLGGQRRGEPPETVGGRRGPREGLLPTEGVTMRAVGRKRRGQGPGNPGHSKASPVAKPRAQGGHGPKEPGAHGATIEPIEPGGELGETREVAAGSSAERQPGRVPRTRVVVYEERRGGSGPGRERAGEGPAGKAGTGGSRER